MLQIHDQGRLLCDGFTRREWLRIGGIALGGLSLSGLLAHETQAAAKPVRHPGRARAVIVVGLLGGPPQHDTWDPKPRAPVEVRGPFGVIPSRTPGLFVGELMPRTAQLTDKIAVLRAVVTNDNAHSSSGYQMLTGVPHQPLNQESATPKAPNNWPVMGAIVRALRPDTGRLPAAITLPEHIWNTGNFPWPGQDAGFLGTRYHPWLVHCDPSNPAAPAPALTLPPEVPPLRFDARKSLLDQVNQHFDGLRQSGVAETFSRNSQKAVELLHASAARKAFDLGQEPATVRERYGNSRFAQSLLLARGSSRPVSAWCR